MTFAVTGGGGSLNPETTRTADGHQSIDARKQSRHKHCHCHRRRSFPDKVFSAEATIPPPPPVLLKISGDGQMPGQTLEPFVVEVRHQDGDPMAGVFVVFLHDDGSLSNVLAATDSNGRAESTLTLGSDTGTTTCHRGGAAG